MSQTIYPVFSFESITIRCLKDIVFFSKRFYVDNGTPQVANETPQAANGTPQAANGTPQAANGTSSDDNETSSGDNKTQSDDNDEFIKTIVSFIDTFSVKPYNMAIAEENIKNILAGVNSILRTINIDNITKFDYHIHIKKLNPNNQNKLWCYRTVLFYQLLIMSVVIMTDPNEYKEFHNTSSINQDQDQNQNQNQTQTYARAYNTKITSAELLNYKMGIFGGLNPTSDIDVGVHYTGNKVNNGLSYIISIVEDLFLIHTEINSLKWDIELYGDLFTITKLDNKEKEVDYYYLNTRDFDAEDFEKLVPSIETSIYRNYLTAKAHNGKLTTKIIDDNKFNYDEFIKFTETYFTDDNKQRLFAIPNGVFSNNSNLNEASKEKVDNYMTADYDSARVMYYNALTKAESKVFEISVTYNPNGSTTTKLSKETTIDIINTIAEALIYRAESYNCSPTIAHVVRVFQASAKTLDNKYRTLSPKFCNANPTDPVCGIGKYGFATSIYEQLGYLYRFYITYNKQGDQNEQELWKAKEQKYNDRIKNAIYTMTQMNPVSAPASETAPASASAPAASNEIQDSVRGGKIRVSKRKLSRNKKNKNKQTRRKI
jgi:hypothetical protein